MNSINQFFKEIDCHFQCYNMGRLIQPIDKHDFIDFEQNQQPWYSPFLQQAWLAIIFWQEPQLDKEPQHSTKPNKHTVWFLKLPLDEQAKINQVARDDFLRRLLSVLGKPQQSTAEKLNALESALKDNPYGFQPKDEQLANFHAIVHSQFSLPASHYYKATQKYFSDSSNLKQWHQLGLQGIADFTARLNESYNNKTNEQLLINSIKHCPLPVLQALGNSLENHYCSEALTLAIYNRLNLALEQDIDKIEQVTFCTTAIRATAQTQDKTLQQQLLNNILKSDAGKDIEVLATIAGRCWLLMTNSQFLSVFLETLARTDSLIEQDIQQQAAFNSIISDLIFIPGLRKPILEKFRSQERSPALTQAIGVFFQQSLKKA